LGIPVVIAASNEDTAYKVTYVGSDNSALGADLAESVGKLTPPNSKVAVIDIQEGMRAVDLRKHALLQTLSQSFSHLQIAQVPFPDSAELNFEESNLQSMMKNALRQSLKSQPEIKALVALDENSTKVAWQVLEAMPSSKRPLLFGVSVDPDLIKACRSGKIAALAVQNARKMGAGSVQAIMGFKEGSRPAQQVLIPYKIIHAES
jgi:ABC-type sugar transport system substrate-binding protein